MPVAQRECRLLSEPRYCYIGAQAVKEVRAKVRPEDFRQTGKG